MSQAGGAEECATACLTRITSFANDAAIGLLVLLVGAVVAIFYLALIRMTLEFYYSVVRMSQDINRRLPPA